MRPLLLTLSAALMAHSMQAEDWRPLDDIGIKEVLTARVLAYPDGAMQNFFADGRTMYGVRTGESWGKWWAEGGKYCSTWPPSETPSCYLVAARGPEIRFTSSGGDETIGQTLDLN